jgi:fumarate reductase subunit D
VQVLPGPKDAILWDDYGEIQQATSDALQVGVDMGRWTYWASIASFGAFIAVLAMLSLLASLGTLGARPGSSPSEVWATFAFSVLVLVLLLVLIVAAQWARYRYVREIAGDLSAGRLPTTDGRWFLGSSAPIVNLWRWGRGRTIPSTPLPRRGEGPGRSPTAPKSVLGSAYALLDLARRVIDWARWSAIAVFLVVLFSCWVGANTFTGILVSSHAVGAASVGAIAGGAFLLALLASFGLFWWLYRRIAPVDARVRAWEAGRARLELELRGFL